MANESDVTKMINQIYFEVRGGEAIKAASKAIQDDFKEIKKYADLANDSAEKVIKNFTTLGKMSPQMSNISSAVYSKQERRLTTNWARHTHGVERDYSDSGNIFNYSAARETWRAVEAEREKQRKLEEKITRETAETLRKMQARNLYETALNTQIQKNSETEKKVTETKEKIRKMTEFQREKIRVADNKNSNYAARTNVFAGRLEESKKWHDETKNWRAYREKHPELFAAGGLSHSVRYQAGRVFGGLGNIASSFGVGGKMLGSLLESIGSLVRSPVAGAATALLSFSKAIIDVGKSAVQAYSEIEAIKTQLGVVFSNQSQADSMFGEISQYAVKSPFGVQQTSELAVLLKQSGVYASDLMKTLRMLGDTAGGNMEKMKRIANNYAQIVSIGKASMLDMRQFAYAGIPIFEAVSKELKVSQQELRKMISDGKVTSDIIEKVFKDLTGINGIFENATEKGAKTLKARLQNLKDAQQLAMGSVGDMIVGFDTKTGNDSLANSIVSTTENIWQWIKEHVDTVNIERDVNTIAKREERIEELSDLMSTFSDNKIMTTLINKAYEAQLGQRDVDTERNIYNKSYESKMRGHNEAVERYGITNREEAEELANAVNFLTNSFNRWNYKLTDEEAYKDGGVLSKRILEAQEVAKKYGIDLEFITTTTKEESKAIRESMVALVQALSDASKLTEEEIKAHRESMIIDAQQLAFDQASRAAGAQTSYNTAFEELFNLYKNSEEYKKKEEEERVKFLKEAKEILQKLVDKYTNADGDVDITKMSYDYLLSLLDDQKRVLDEGTKLTVVEGKSEQQMTEDRKLLSAQWNKASKDIVEELSKNGNQAAVSELEAVARAYSLEGSNTSFYTNFNKILETQLGILEELANSSSADKQQEYRDMAKVLMASTFKYSVNPDALLGNPEDLLKGTSNEFIPLWKRILSSATGLTTNGMTGTIQTMTNYRDDMAIRNMASNVLSATMKSMGIDKAMSLMRTNNAVQLTGDSGKTFQIDWLETKKAIKNFATQLSASTEVIVAYKNSLQEELDVYEKLIAAGYTEAESTDLGSQKFVSSTQLAKLALGNESQLVNAFGEIIETESGKRYKTSEIEFKNGQMYDKLGNKINEEVKITGNLFEFIKGELPRLRDEIHEATVAEANNKVIKELYDNVLNTSLMSKYLQFGRNSNIAKFVQDNPSYVNEIIDSYITKTRPRYSGAYKEINEMSNEDIIAYGLRYNNDVAEEYDTKIKEAKAAGNKDLEEKLTEELIKLETSSDLLSSAFGDLETYIKNLLETGLYEDLKQKNYTKTRDDALNAMWLKMIGVNQADQLSPTAWLDEGGYDLFYKFIKDMYGVDSQYTMEDLYNKGLANGGKMKNYNIFSKRFGKEVEWTEGGEEVYLNGNRWFGEGLVEETLNWNKALQDTLETMKSLGEETSNLVGELSKKTLLTPFETGGEFLAKKWVGALQDGEEWTVLTAKAMKDLGAETLKSLGSIMAKAGFELIARGAINGNWAMIAGGFALAATGGFATGIGGALTEGQKDSKSDSEADKLQDLKDQLADLLEQARKDALYYESNLRHKTALGINRGFSMKSVNDAIITPQGDVVTTDPKDYLIATKTPGQFAGNGGVTVSPVINCNVVNNTNAKVTQQQQQNADGSIDIITIIEDTVGQYIASSKSDDAFSSRDYRLRGRQSIMN